MKFIATVILLLLTAVSATPQCVISGTVTTPDGAPVGGAVVRLLDGSTILSYTISGDNGFFSLSADSHSNRRIILLAESLGYTSVRDTIPAVTATIPVTLVPGGLNLKEVTVAAPSIRERGDTLSYSLKAFAGKGDVTLRDALTKLPGVDVEESGAVKYQGKAISQFSIEGMDLLGGKYNIATNNIPASHVSTVEVVTNHHDRKIDRDRFSDDVALNIKLEPWARFKPFGTYEAAAGLRDDCPLYSLSAAGMMFNSRFQAILTAKIGNLEAFADDEHHIHFGNSGRNPSEVNILGSLATAEPPVSKRRYISPDDRSISLNLLNKRGDNVTLRTNIDYSRSRERFSSSTATEYFLPDGDLTISRSARSRSTSHDPSLSLDYKLDADNRYISNRLSARATFLRNSLPITDGSLSYGQQQRMDAYAIANDFSTTLRHGATKWNLSSLISYLSSPSGCITVTGDENISQRASSARFLTDWRLSASWGRRYVIFSLPVDLSFTHDHITTGIDASESQTNRLNGNKLKISLNPTIEYNHPARILNLRASAGVSALFYDYRNSGSSPASARRLLPVFSPNIYLSYRPASRSAFIISLSHSRATGDILNMLTAPIHTDYISSSVNSGIIADTRSLSGFITYKFQMPIEMFFINTSINASRRNSNLLSGLNVGSGSVDAVALPSRSHDDTASGSLSFTKQVRSIGTKFTLSASASWSRRQTVQNSLPTTFFSRAISLAPAVNSRPWQWIELDYRGDISRTFSRFPGHGSSYFSHNHRLSLSIFPIPRLEIKASADITGRQLADGITKTMTLADMKARYKFRSFQFTAGVNNIFDTRRYHYTIYNGIDRFTADYALQGRQFYIKASFNI